MHTLVKILNNFTAIDETAQATLAKMVVKNEYPKGAILLEQGNVCRRLYVVEKGFARGFYYQDGKDITSWFAAEQDVITAMASFISQKPSFESIELLESSVLYSIDYSSLQYLYKIYPEINTIGRLFTERYYIALEARTTSLQFQSATERYQNLLAEQPGILQRASLGQIASFLGISQETLSRIRGKI